MLETICIPENSTEIQSCMAQGMDREMIRDHLLRRFHALLERLRILEGFGDENGVRGPAGHEILETKDGWAVTIKWKDSRSLSDLLEEGNPDPDTVPVMAGDLARALQFLDEQGLRHGGICPDNILVTEEGRFLLTGLGDWRPADAAATDRVDSGICRNSDRSMDYSAPWPGREGLDGRRADLYSLGLVLFLCLNRRIPPFASRPLYPSGSPDRISPAGLREAEEKRRQADRLPRPMQGGEAMAGLIGELTSAVHTGRFYRPADLIRALEGMRDRPGAAQTREPAEDSVFDSRPEIPLITFKGKNYRQLQGKERTIRLLTGILLFLFSVLFFALGLTPAVLTAAYGIWMIITAAAGRQRYYGPYGWIGEIIGKSGGLPRK